MTNNTLETIHKDYMELTSEFIACGENPFACAAAMTNIALAIYKTQLNADEYNKMVDAISASRNRITAFNHVSKNQIN
jgi:hypothetical protein